MNFALLCISQLLAYLLVLLAAAYAGTLLAVIIGAVCLVCWLIAHLVEWVEPSKVPAPFYTYLLSGWLAPFGAVLMYALLRGGLTW